MSNDLSINIETIIDTVKQVYSNCHELRLTGHYQAFIEFNGDIVIGFKNLGELYAWILARQTELEEQDDIQRKENARINGESANFNIMDHRWG